jgi:hypothetical protein
MTPLEANSLTTASVSTHIEAVGHLRPVERAAFPEVSKEDGREFTIASASNKVYK